MTAGVTYELVAWPEAEDRRWPERNIVALADDWVFHPGTTPQTVHDLLVEFEPDRLVIEVCGIVGWIHDLAADLDIPI